MNDTHLRAMQQKFKELGLSIDQIKERIALGKLSGYFEKSEQQFQTRLGIFCTCEKPDNLHLWENYSSHGFGFNVGIDSKYLTEKRSVAGFGGKLTYVTNLPPIIPYSKLEAELFFEKTAIKLLKYEKEDEYRLIKFNIKKRLKTFPEEAFLNITLGYNIPDKEKIKLKRVISNYLPNIQMREAINTGGVITFT